MNNDQIRTLLENADQDAAVYPEDLETQEQVKRIFFDALNGWYETIEQDGSHYRICALCGEKQPMNAQAYRNEGLHATLKDIRAEIKAQQPNLTVKAQKDRLDEQLRGWNNNPCERSHKPFRADHTLQIR